MIKSELVVKASQELDEKVKNELAKADPSEEKANASLKENEITKTEEAQ